jgi:hypothetical protein
MNNHSPETVIADKDLGGLAVGTFIKIDFSKQS